MPPIVTFIRPELTQEEFNIRLKNVKSVIESILNTEVDVYFEDESKLNIIDKK